MPPTKSRWLRFLLLPVAAVLALGLYSFWYEPASLRTVRHFIHFGESARLSPSPLRIAVIADLHAGAPYIDEAKIQKVVALANAAKPDLILLAGDYIGDMFGRPSMPIETIAAKLRPLSAPMGVYAVLGNHDEGPDADHITKALEQAGIAVLENKTAKLAKDGSLYLAGIAEWGAGPNHLKALFKQIPAGARAICFMHSPDLFPALPKTCALTVAAHTHGGQVLLPYFGRPMVMSRYGQRYAAGLIREDGKTLFVNTGIGTSRLPIRFGVPPEVSVLEIQ